jgi:hypothetical protein
MSGVGILGGSGVDGFATSGGGGGTEFADDVFRIQDDGDPTKQLAFQVSGVGAGTTRTLTVPDASGVVLLGDASQTTEFIEQTTESWYLESTVGQGQLITASNMFITAGGNMIAVADGNLAFASGSEVGFEATTAVSFTAPEARFGKIFDNVAVVKTDDLAADRTVQFPDGDGILAIRVAVPATASSAGEPGMWASDGSHAYFCHATDTWVRVAVGSW